MPSIHRLPRLLCPVAAVLLALPACGQDTSDPPHATDLTTAWAGPAYGEDPDFAATWFDGNAELAGYELTYPRYGVERTGTAVAITVTEHLNPETGIKTERPGDNSLPVVKLNLVEDFPTGVYDYSLMTSAFAAMRPVHGLPAGHTTKVSFSSQEWCGHVYQQALFRDSGIEVDSHSYFEGEGDRQQQQDHSADGFAEDALFLWARGMAGPQLQPGQTLTVPLYRSMAVQRLWHIPSAWDTATLQRSEGTEQVEVPAGQFEAIRYTAEVAMDATTRLYGGAPVPASTRTWTYLVEANPPHRVLRYSRSDGLDAQLIASDRMPYWSLNGPEGIEALERIGLQPRPGRTP